MDDEIELIDEEESELDKLRKKVTIKENNQTPSKKEESSPKKKTKKVLKKVERKKSKRVLGIKLILLSILLVPLFGYLYIISLHSHDLINKTLSIVMLVLTIISLLIFITGCVMTIFNKKIKTGRKVKTWFKVVMGIFLTGYVTVSTVVMILLYGPNNQFRDWLVTTAMMTMNHQYLATWFYNDEMISEVLSRNTIVEIGEDTNPDLIDMGNVAINDEKIYANEFEEAILTKEHEDDIYKIIDIDYGKFKGKMAVIYDPSKVKLAVSKGIGMDENAYGQMITTMGQNNNASVSMNAGGFYDPDWNSKGGVPHGVVISNGKIVSEGHGRAVGAGGLIGFNKENKLVLIKGKVTGKQALAQGIRDAVDFGPFLIVNGKSSYVKGNGGWGRSPRSAIAQRKDGIVLFLVIDGRQTASAGADMNDLVKVLLDYGAYNAANLDGGTSSAMALDGKIITNPRNGNYQAKTRAVPNAWIVTK